MTRRYLFFVALLLLTPALAFAQAKELPGGKLSFTTPNAPWELVITAKGFGIGREQLRPDDASGDFLFSNSATLFNVSIFIEPVSKCKTSKECRDMVLKTGNPTSGKYEKLLLGEIGDVSYFEFYRPMVQNRPVRVFDLYAEFVKDGYWADLHISKLLYDEFDHDAFEDLVRSVEFIPKKR
jgi:hypothetical protein